MLAVSCVLRAHVRAMSVTAAAHGVEKSKPPSGDVLFDSIAKVEALSHEGKSTEPWGRVLDAGTGRQSLTWMLTLPNLRRWSAITADESMATTMRNEVLGPCEDRAAVDRGELVIGNWDDPELLRGETFDVILADYLIGTIDGFSPFTQELTFQRLRRHLAPGGRLYVIGLQPLPDHAPAPADVVCEVRRLRDACILLAGHRCYREFPLDWCRRHLAETDLEVVKTESFPILYSEASIGRQIDVAARKLPLFEDRALAASMRAHIDALRVRVKQRVQSAPSQRIKLGFDYVISCRAPATGAPVAVQVDAPPPPPPARI